MNDYKELIELLAHPADGRDNADIMICAADAIEQLIKERDAAVADLNVVRSCATCKSNGYSFCDGCDFHRSKKNWEWRGVQ